MVTWACKSPDYFLEKSVLMMLVVCNLTGTLTGVMVRKGLMTVLGLVYACA
jgi:hypothetical protein